MIYKNLFVARDARSGARWRQLMAFSAPEWGITWPGASLTGIGYEKIVWAADDSGEGAAAVNAHPEWLEQLGSRQIVPKVR